MIYVDIDAVFKFAVVEACRDVGGQAEFARLCGSTQPTISKMLKNSRRLTRDMFNAIWGNLKDENFPDGVTKDSWLQQSGLEFLRRRQSHESAQVDLSLERFAKYYDLIMAEDKAKLMAIALSMANKRILAEQRMLSGEGRVNSEESGDGHSEIVPGKLRRGVTSSDPVTISDYRSSEVFSDTQSAMAVLA